MAAEPNSAKRTKLRARSLLYHDVVDAGAWDSTGFPGPAAAHYKLTWADFEKHLEAIHRVLHAKPVTISDLQARPEQKEAFLLHFDDGGISSLQVADAIEKYGWRAHFFISTDYVGKPGFLNPAQVVDLRKKGHVVGSHSCSHPRRMSACSKQDLVQEWKQSADVLSQITGEPITVASVPGGNYSRRVAESAAEAGIKILFTSEPTTRSQMVNGCWVLGRYAVLRDTSATSAAALASGQWLPCTRQLVVWKSKMALKSIGGDYYDKFRDLCFGERAVVKAQSARY